MNAATPTPSSPDTAGCSACLRTIRHAAITAPAASAEISAGCSSKTTFATTNTATGMVEATTPCTPPICSSRVGDSRSCRGPSAAGPSGSGSAGGPWVGPWVTVLLAPRTGGGPVHVSVLLRAGGPASPRVPGRWAGEFSRESGRVGRADLVERVVEDLAPVPDGEPPSHAHGAPRLDAGDASPAEPDQ